MTSREKKEISILGAVALVVLIVVYFTWFKKPADTEPVVATPVVAGTVFPNGTDLDIKPLQDPNFTNMIRPIYPVVTKSEVGAANPFSPAAAGPSVQVPPIEVSKK